MNETQKLVYEFIVAHKRKHDGNSPTIREIQKGCGISSSSVVSYHLQRLEEKGKIRRNNADARGIEVVGGAWELRRT